MTGKWKLRPKAELELSDHCFLAARSFAGTRGVGEEQHLVHEHGAPMQLPMKALTFGFVTLGTFSRVWVCNLELGK